MLHNCFRLLFVGLFLSAWLSAGFATAAVTRDPFPVYDSMKANVAFWETVYAKYPTTKGLIHDNRHLSIIYEIIDLKPQGQPGSRSNNKKKIKKVKEKYKRILFSLAAGNPAKTKEEKRVRALFGKNISAKHLKNYAYSIRFQLCQQDRFKQGVVRSGKYLAEMEKIFRSYGLPEDLAYLPHVESSFNYKAYSKFGAAGVWQFIRSTGKRFMTVDYTLDERRDPIRATHAAARFLKENHQKLGSWPLALTAYNHGATGMMRAKKKLGNYDTIFNKYDGKRFGFASRNFYSEFIAARNVAVNYKKHFGSIKLDRPVSAYEVIMPGYAPVENISRFFHVDLPTLQELNPALRPPVFQGRKYIPKGYRLRLPGKNGKMARLAKAMPDSLFVDKQKRSRFYRVQKGLEVVKEGDLTEHIVLRGKGPFMDLADHSENAAKRIRTLYRLIADEVPMIVVTTVDALLHKIIPKQEIINYAELIEKGEEIDRDLLVKKLLCGGYVQSMIVEEPGDFCIRGGILDIFSPLYSDPLRIELFGDTVDSLRFFSAADQRTTKNILEAVILPAKEAILKTEHTDEIITRIRAQASPLGISVTNVRELVNRM